MRWIGYNNDDEECDLAGIRGGECYIWKHEELTVMASCEMAISTSSWFQGNTGSPPQIPHVVGFRIASEHTVLLRFIQSSATSDCDIRSYNIRIHDAYINAGSDFSGASIDAQKLGVFQLPTQRQTSIEKSAAIGCLACRRWSYSDLYV